MENISKLAINDEVRESLFGKAILGSSTNRADTDALVAAFRCWQTRLGKQELIKANLIYLDGYVPVKSIAPKENTLHILGYAANEASKDKEVPKGYVRLNTPKNPLEQFFNASGIGEVVAYCNNDKKHTVLSLPNSISNIAYILAAIVPKMCPWLQNTMSTKEELDFALEIREKKYDKLSILCKELYEKYDIEALITEQMLDGLETCAYNTLLKQAEAEESKFRDEFNIRYKALQDTTNFLRNAQMKLSALKNQGASETGSIKRFFKGHKNISLLEKKVESNNEISFTFNIRDTIEYIDKVALTNMLKKQTSVINSCGAKTARIIKALFIEDEGKLKTWTTFTIKNLSTMSNNSSMNGIYKVQDAFPHPHLKFYSCLGGNAAPISDFLRQGDWDMAIEQAIAATKNWNVNDSVVTSTFVKKIKESLSSDLYGKCIINGKGQEMTIAEYANYLDAIDKEAK